MGMKSAALAEESVNTVTPVRAAPERFIWWAQRHTDGPIAETELLCDYGKDGGKNSSLGHNNGLTVPRCF